MVWIHGGGFFAGSGNPDIYGPDYFMDYDVIVVSVNYRVGPLGFFTLENEEVKMTIWIVYHLRKFTLENEEVKNNFWFVYHLDKFRNAPNLHKKNWGLKNYFLSCFSCFKWILSCVLLTIFLSINYYENVYSVECCS